MSLQLLPSPHQAANFSSKEIDFRFVRDVIKHDLCPEGATSSPEESPHRGILLSRRTGENPPGVFSLSTTGLLQGFFVQLTVITEALTLNSG